MSKCVHRERERGIHVGQLGKYILATCQLPSTLPEKEKQHQYSLQEKMHPCNLTWIPNIATIVWSSHFWVSKSSKFLGCFHRQLLSAGHLALIVAVRLRHIPGIPSCQVLLPVLCVTTTCRTIGSALLPLESVWIQPWVSPWNVSLKADPPWFLQQLSGGGGWNTFRGQKMEPNLSQNSKICQQKSSTSHFEVPIEFMYEYICLYIRLMFMKICRANIPNMGQNLWRAERFPWQFWPPPELRNGNGQPNELPCKFDWFMRGSVFHGLWNHPYTKPGSDSSPICSKEPG